LKQKAEEPSPVSSSDEDNVIITGTSVTEARVYLFYPVNQEWQTRMAAMFGEGDPIQNIYGETEDATPMQHHYPSRLKNVKGDGACLPRSFSLVIWGHERNHQFLRDAVVDILLSGPLPGETEPRGPGFEAEMKKMRLRATHMTTREVEAFAFLLDTPIFTCVKSGSGRQRKYYWQRIPHEGAEMNVTNGRGVYIFNANDHFQVVLQP